MCLPRNQGTSRLLADAAAATSDVAFCADPHTYKAFRAHADPAVRLAANSGALRAALVRRSRRPVLDGIGGIRTSQFRPSPALRAGSPLRVLVNGRRSRPKKGTDLVLRALAPLVGRVPVFEIVLFDTVDAHNRQDPRDGAPLPPG